jgi:(p)ppGpp synthase/HD superfamily hydrolase
MIQLEQKFEEALLYATRLHREQRRKGKDVSYLGHLLGTAALVLEMGGDEKEAIAALLHDAVEDQGGLETREEIRGRFGEGVARIVDGCTDATTIPKPPWRPRKETYVAHLAQASPSVLLVSCADKLFNARSLLVDYRMQGERIWDYFTGGKAGTLWYYRALVTAFDQAEATPRALVKELDWVVSEIERLAAAL